MVLNEGEIEQIGTPLEVYRNPVSTFVASFIGSPPMSLLNAESDGQSVKIGDAVIPMNGHAASAGPVTLGTRADAFADRSAPGAIPVSLKVAYVEELGAERLVHADLAGQRVVLTLSPEVPMGDQLELGLTPDRVHLFDQNSGKRLA